MGYRLEGKMLEVCTCEVICPCWVGRDPDGGTCKGVIAYHFTPRPRSSSAGGR